PPAPELSSAFGQQRMPEVDLYPPVPREDIVAINALRGSQRATLTCHGKVPVALPLLPALNHRTTFNDVAGQAAVSYAWGIHDDVEVVTMQSDGKLVQSSQTYYPLEGGDALAGLHPHVKTDYAPGKPLITDQDTRWFDGRPQKELHVVGDRTH